MQSVQESKQELEASIRYAENAISSAKQTIESMTFRQEMAKKQHSEQTGREKALDDENIHLQQVVIDLETFVEELRDDKVRLNRKVEALERDLTDNSAKAEVWKKEADKLRHKVCERFEPTMPVIPKAVAIAIFREGMQHGVEAACSELEGQTIEVEENEYYGHFEVSFSKSIELDDELDLDWMRGKVGNYSEEFITGALGSLCADKEFECRIHGVDDEAKDSASS